MTTCSPETDELFRASATVHAVLERASAWRRRLAVPSALGGSERRELEVFLAEELPRGMAAAGRLRVLLAGKEAA